MFTSGEQWRTRANLAGCVCVGGGGGVAAFFCLSGFCEDYQNLLIFGIIFMLKKRSLYSD